MNVDTFLKHHGISDNPFAAEEARLDPIFAKITQGATDHPDFPKIMGELSQPSTAIVFGEKGSGKTAIRLLLGKKINDHNGKSDKPVLAVAYDDLNPVLDKLLQHHKQDADAMLKGFKLDDHQDAILSQAVTKLVSCILGQRDDSPEPVPAMDVSGRAIRAMPKQTRVDLAVLAALYDEPRSGSAVPRFAKFRRAMRIGPRLPLWIVVTLGIVVTVAAAALWFAKYFVDDAPLWLLPSVILGVALAALAWGYAGWRWLTLWLSARRVVKAMPAVSRSTSNLRQMLEMLKASHLAGQPLPQPPSQGTGGTDLGDTRYQLTRRFISALTEMGFAGMIVFIDRMDEPTLVHGDAGRMKSITWPMFDNKFLKQDNLGLKMLLPLELRYELNRESSKFFQEARLDKQNMVDRLTWSGATLYDLCNQRLAACATDSQQPGQLVDLFTEDVSREQLIDALDQMHQPRDAFKFLYAVIQEHCKMVPEASAEKGGEYKIPKLTLESVRRFQSQRVEELYRGRAPA